jgi:polyhydroxyalkanoate synthesis regulator phasin
MFELFEKAVMTGLGAISLSQKKGEEFINDLKEKYKMSEEEGKAFLEKLQGMAKDSKSKVAELAEEEVKKAMDRIGLASKNEIELLQKRLDELEKKLGSQDL